MTSTSLPLEIEEKIIDFLAEDNYAASALKTCSLVCQAFLPICRKHIFASISLRGPLFGGAQPTPHALGKLLSERPEIANYIRKLKYDIGVDMTNPSVPESLTRISRLESLSIWSYYGRVPWIDYPIRPTSLHLLHLPTLTHLKMFGIHDFVIWDLIHCVNLKHLAFLEVTCESETTFHATVPKDPIQLHEFIAHTDCASAIMKLCTAQRPDGQSLIDFRSLSKITVFLATLKGGEASQELLRRCEMLADVHITFDNPRNVRPSLANMLRPSMQTLKHIVVNVHVNNVDDATLIGIPSELEDMRTTKNMIETITIEVRAQQDGNGPGEDSDWRRFDEVLTSPGWFALKRVSLTIVIMSRRRDSDDGLEREGALRDLPETHFPRLSTSNYVSYHFEVNYR